MSARVLVAMSGGVDSSVAAAILRERGYEVVGIAMRLAPEPAPSAVRGRGTCCSHDDFEDARRVAERMDFPFYVIDLRAEFSTRVIDYFVGEYVGGRTPNPCVMCNRDIKFDRLWKRARAIEADFVATGHYARIERDAAGRHHLLRAADSAKDQSYFLFNLTAEQLARTLFPLGELTKDEVRAMARALGLRNADKPESQEICFVPDGDYARFIERYADRAALRPGYVVDSRGTALARHGGIHRFTVGQRRGLGIATGEPVYVRSIDSATGDVTIGSSAELGARGLIATNVNLLDPSLGERHRSRVDAKIRYRHPMLPATLTGGAPGSVEVLFDNPGPAVTPGQACVFYRGDEVVGGGFIERAL
ncbi:MAG: tRNA 2-thiouridine(34) synthase MnmA [Candidatus Binataceae bacterium]